MQIKLPFGFKFKVVARDILYVSGISTLLLLGGCSNENDAATTEVADAEPIVVAETQTATTTAVIAETPASMQAPTAKIETIESFQSDSVDAIDVSADTVTEVLSADTGAKIYESNCQACHANGLLNAPKYGDTAAWAQALQKDKETLYKHSAQGFNKMPAQAVNGVTEAQVKAAVDYMLVAVS